MPAIVPSGRCATIPEMNTSFPLASTAIACAKCPAGFGALLVSIACLAMVFSLSVALERVERFAARAAAMQRLARGRAEFADLLGVRAAAARTRGLRLAE